MNFLFTLALKINRQPVKCRNRLMTNKRLVNSFTNECRIAFRMLIVIKKSYDREMMREFYCWCLFTLVVVLSLGYKSIWIFFLIFVDWMCVRLTWCIFVWNKIFFLWLEVLIIDLRKKFDYLWLKNGFFLLVWSQF